MPSEFGYYESKNAKELDSYSRSNTVRSLKSPTSTTRLATAESTRRKVEKPIENSDQKLNEKNVEEPTQKTKEKLTHDNAPEKSGGHEAVESTTKADN